MAHLKRLPTVLFAKDAGLYWVGSPRDPIPWIGANADALAVLHHLVQPPHRWRQQHVLPGTHDAVRAYLRNAHRGLVSVAPLLAAELARGLRSKREPSGAGVCSLWRYDPVGALVCIQTELDANRLSRT